MWLFEGESEEEQEEIPAREKRVCAACGGELEAIFKCEGHLTFDLNTEVVDFNCPDFFSGTIQEVAIQCKDCAAIIDDVHLRPHQYVTNVTIEPPL
jgi:hypothetical protein